jgi:NAD(P)-dependent dehydrogenase (short-subunit alcohol dehydrogenase family)
VMNDLLSGKICIIAGAGAPRGIGLATARLFAEHGASLVLADIQASDAAIAEISADFTERSLPAPETLAVRCDISDRADCDQLVSAAIERFGTIDILVNSAGVVGSGPLLDIDADMLDRMISINLKGAFNLCQATLALFMEKQSGNIVNIASLAAQRGGGLVGGAHYAASKGGVVSLTRSIAREFGPHGIRANTICPAMAQTNMLDGLTDAQIDAIKAEIPLRRLGSARDVAGACLFLASDLSNFVTGATLDVNGGLHIH